jgi:hypothetical protein
MGKITIEDQDGKRVYIGELTSISLSYDTLDTSSTNGAQHVRNGKGSLNLSMNFVNGRVDALHFDE